MAQITSGVIPACTGVILYGDAGTYELTSSESATAIGTNYLVANLANYTLPASGTYNSETQYAYTLTDGLYHYEITVVPDYYTTAAQEAKVDAGIAQVITELHLSGLNEYERIRAVCDYVEGHVQYDQVHKKHPTYHLRSTAYGALVNSRATCQGYAVLLYRLLREAGSIRPVPLLFFGVFRVYLLLRPLRLSGRLSPDAG